MNDKSLPDAQHLTRLMADAERRIRDRHGPRRRRFSALLPLVSAHVFVITSCATAVAGVTIMGLF